jgi:hypothetical protein
VAALAIQHLARREMRFATDMTSAIQRRGSPVGSCRSATEATEIPSSSPMRWNGSYVAVYRPLSSVTSPYSRKQRSTYALAASTTTYTPQRRSRGTGEPSRARLETTSTWPA